MAEFSRSERRIDLRRPAEMVDCDGAVSKIVFLDISASGFRIQFFEAARVGELVTFRAARAREFTGCIRWVIGDEAGGTFLDPIDHGEMA